VVNVMKRHLPWNERMNGGTVQINISTEKLLKILIQTAKATIQPENYLKVMFAAASKCR
jgi:hypothetical protein